MRNSKKAKPARKATPLKKAPKKPAQPQKASLKIITVQQKDGVKVSGSIIGSKGLMAETIARLAINDKEMGEVLLSAFGMFLVLKKEEALPKKKK